VKTAVVILLSVAQLLSWNAAPLYLCRCGSASVCLDSGPENCTCCRASCHDHERCCNDDDDCCGHKCCTPGDRPCPCRDTVRPVVINRACDCEHLLLISSQAPVVTSASGAHALKLLAGTFDVACSYAAAASLSRAAAPPATVFLCAPLPDLSMSDAGRVVLRC